MLSNIEKITSQALLEARMKNMRDRYNNLLDDDDPFAEGPFTVISSIEVFVTSCDIRGYFEADEFRCRCN